jgi:hypothetical protein
MNILLYIQVPAIGPTKEESLVFILYDYDFVIFWYTFIFI